MAAAPPPSIPRSRRGAKGKLKTELAHGIISAVAAGQTDRVACQLVGIGVSTLYEWLQKGKEQDSGRYHEFQLAYEKARADSEVPLVTVARRSATGGVFRIRMFDEEGNQMFTEDGRPKFRSVTLLPDGRLALQLLQVRNPRDYGGKDAVPEERTQRPALAPGAIINLFQEAFQILKDHNIKPTFEMPKDNYHTVDKQAGLPAPADTNGNGGGGHAPDDDESGDPIFISWWDRPDKGLF
jgi:hypothetical protein